MSYTQTLATGSSLSPQDLRELGRSAVAYVRPAESDGVAGFAIHGADGTVIGFAPDLAKAVGAILEHGMELANLH